ncbi:MAG: glycosyltransferase family 39 protein [Candidatus Obscuribacterales bacterium]|nr:glycosyltransferase family 39 protein [Candidatus Obscuribacterales bacterium]
MISSDISSTPVTTQINESTNTRSSRSDYKSIQSFVLFLVLAMALCISIIFRLSNLEKREYYIDEALTSLNVAGYTYKNVSLLQPGYRIIQAGELSCYQTVNRSPGKCLTALAKNGGEHPPLYFLLSWCWQKVFSNDIFSMRLLPALLSLSSFPFIYCLCLELFRKPGDLDKTVAGTTAVIATCIAALSPFQLLYSQYAREYSLWFALTALSSWQFLRSVRTGNAISWLNYSVATTLSLYTHPLSVAVAAGQFLYSFVISKFKVTELLKQQTVALSAAAFMFSPWALQMAINKQASDEMLKWLERKVPLQSLVETWLKNTGHLYFQIPDLDKILIALACLIILGGFVTLWVKCKKQFFFVLTLVLSGLLPMALPDLAFGGVRSQTPRYLIPAILGLLIPTAFLFALLVSQKLRTIRTIGSSLLAGFLALELLSCAYISGAADHPELPMHGVCPREIAQVVNKADSPLIICPIGRKYMSYMLTLSHYLKPNVALLVCSSDAIPAMPGAYQTLFIFNPSLECFTRFQRDPHFQIEELANIKTLWLMRYSGPTVARY